MPEIFARAQTPSRGAVTLEARAVRSQQESDHNIAQLIERVGCALIDAEQIESQTSMLDPEEPMLAGIHLRNGSGARRELRRDTRAGERGGSPRWGSRGELRSCRRAPGCAR
jgi:hypothetical protein